MSTKYDDVYQHLQLEIKLAVIRFCVPAAIADDMASAITARLKKAMCGETMYFPLRQSREQRHALIKQDFNGINHDEVCKKHGISRKTLYRAISQ